MVRLCLQLLYRRKPLRLVWNHPLYGESRERKSKGLMSGRYPVTRTLPYLEQGIRLRDCVRIMSIHYGNYNNEIHQGTKDVALLNYQQFQYCNPDVQIELIENLTPSPFFTFFLDNGENIVVDTEGKDQIEILKHINKVVGKPRELIAMETKAVEENSSNFGESYKRKCICEVEGQVPCTKLCKDNVDANPWALSGKHTQQNLKKLLYGKET